MKSEKVAEFLKSQGYQFELPVAIESDSTIARYYRTYWELKAPYCVLNNKPPTIVISEFLIEEGKYQDNPEVRRFSTFIRNEAPQGWVDLKFYSLSETDLIERLDDFVAALIAAWSELFKADLLRKAQKINEARSKNLRSKAQKLIRENNGRD